MIYFILGCVLTAVYFNWKKRLAVRKAKKPPKGMVYAGPYQPKTMNDFRAKYREHEALDK